VPLTQHCQASSGLDYPTGCLQWVVLVAPAPTWPGWAGTVSDVATGWRKASNCTVTNVDILTFRRTRTCLWNLSELLVHSTTLWWAINGWFVGLTAGVLWFNSQEPCLCVVVMLQGLVHWRDRIKSVFDSALPTWICRIEWFSRKTVIYIKACFMHKEYKLIKSKAIYKKSWRFCY